MKERVRTSCIHPAAYLFIGIDHQEILHLTKMRVENILLMKVKGSKEGHNLGNEKHPDKDDIVWT